MFFQDGPKLRNQYTNDRWLQSFLRAQVPAKILSSWHSKLTQVGDDAVGILSTLADEAERNPPSHEAFDVWGKRIDKIHTSAAWRELESYASRERLVGMAFEREFGALTRIYQMALIYLYHPSSAIFTCPLAMTDGAARVLEIYGKSKEQAATFAHLIARPGYEAWTSGQWMTERSGGSDISRSETQAVPDTSGKYFLQGDKWFTSATTSNVALVMARIQGQQGLSLFLVKLHDSAGSLNCIEVLRLKNKFGTRALPTAELSIRGASAELVGEAEKGVKTVASLLNITRIYNSVSAIGYMRRGLALLEDYAEKREVFGRKLSQQPLFQQAFADIYAESWELSNLTFFTISLLGKEECGESNEQEKALLRLLTPIVKLFTAKRAVAISSEIMELFGGVGYMEESGLPVIARNTQALAIWEGTSDVLSLDLLRVLRKDCPWPMLQQWLRDYAAFAGAPTVDLIQALLPKLEAAVLGISQNEAHQAGARNLALALGHIFAGLPLGPDVIFPEWLQNSTLHRNEKARQLRKAGTLLDEQA